MFRTRDFILLFTTIVFLVAAIGATVFTQWQDSRSGSSDGSFAFTGGIASTSDLVLSAVVPGDEEGDRLRRLNQMREKISAVELENQPEEEIVAVLEDSLEEATTTDEMEAESVTMTCGSYAPYIGFWDPRSTTVELREGAIVAERMLEAGPVIMLQLPARLLPNSVPSCIANDVIGIANDGSLIRNDEVSLYSVFGSETQIGYALDGLPIHGMSTARGDACGGVVVAGQYRYELSADRDTVIQCFSGTPVPLP